MTISVFRSEIKTSNRDNGQGGDRILSLSYQTSSFPTRSVTVHPCCSAVFLSLRDSIGSVAVDLTAFSRVLHILEITSTALHKTRLGIKSWHITMNIYLPSLAASSI